MSALQLCSRRSFSPDVVGLSDEFMLVIVGIGAMHGCAASIAATALNRRMLRVAGNHEHRLLHLKRTEPSNGCGTYLIAMLRQRSIEGGLSVSTESPECKFLRKQWQVLQQTDITLAALQVFYARYKYLIMSRHIATYEAIGLLLANPNKSDLSAVAQRLFEFMLRALATPATRGGNVNALLHISGYLKNQLQPNEKSVLREAIEAHGRGEVELEVPAAILRDYFRRFPNAYIEQQVFLQSPLFFQAP